MSFASFLSKVKGKKVLLLTHAGCDVDAFSAAAALKLSLEKECQPVLGIPDHINLTAKALAHKMKIEFELNPNPDKFQGLILVDLNSLDMTGRLEEEIKSYSKPIFVLDHHTKSNEKITTPEFTLIEENAVSSTEIVYKLFKKQKIKITPAMASLLAAGIITDSAHFTTATANTFAIMSELLALAKNDFSQIRDLFSVEKDASEKIAKLKAAKRLRLFKVGSHLIGFSEVGSFEADAANMLVRFGLDVCFVGSQEGEDIKISGRAAPQFVRAQKFDLAKHVFFKLCETVPGKGGGHPGAAAFNGQTEKPLDKAMQDCINLTFNFLKKKNPKFTLKEYS